MVTNVFYFHTRQDAIEFTKRFNPVNYSVNIYTAGNQYQVVVQYWSLD